MNAEAKVLVPGLPGHHAAIKPAPPPAEGKESKRKSGGNEVRHLLRTDPGLVTEGNLGETQEDAAESSAERFAKLAAACFAACWRGSQTIGGGRGLKTVYLEAKHF